MPDDDRPIGPTTTDDAPQAGLQAGLQVRRKAARIVQALDSDEDGLCSSGEVKILFSAILGLPVADIPDVHVVQFAGLANEAFRPA